MAGYGITDAYTKTATDNAINKAIVNKADKASTLEGYGITDAYTKSETAGAINTAVAGKADKASTLEGYGITDAYTKEAVDAADVALSDRIGTIGENGLIIRTDKNIAENLTLIDQALQDQTGIARDVLDKKADADASNVGRNAKDASGNDADNSEAWGSALGTGAVENGNGKLITGAAVYSEVRPAEDGEYVKKESTTAANLAALDAQVKSNADAVELNAKNIESNTTNIKNNTQAIATNADNIITAQETADMAMTGVAVLLAGTEWSIDGVIALDEKVDKLAAQDGKVAVQGEEHADEFVKGSTVYTYLNDGEDGKGSLALGKNSSKITIGQGSSATGNQSIAIGFGNTVTGNNSGAFGDPSDVSGSGSYAVGNDNTVSGNNTFVLGSNVNATGNNTVVLGGGSDDSASVNVTGKNSVVLGVDSDGSQDNVVSVGSVGAERKIVHVAEGNIAEGSTDAVTGGQLYEVNRNAYNNAVYLNNSINRLDSKVNKVGAGAAALAALHPIDMDNKFGMGLGYGNYRDAHSMALGLFYRPQDNLMFSIGGAMGNGENMINAGISIALDKGFSNSKAMMARKIQAQAEELEAQRQTNAVQEEKIQKLEAENEEIKARNARLEARLAAIEAKLGQ